MFGYFKIHLLVLTLHLALTSSSFSSLASSSTEDEKQIRSTSLKKKLDTLKSKITKAQDKREIYDLIKLNEKFNALAYDRSEWQKQAERSQLEKWPNQTWKQSVGSHLFYPHQVDDYLSCPSTSHLVGRRDILWSFALASEHNHPLAQYHLARKLDDLHAEHKGGARPALLDHLYRYSLDILEKCIHVPQACYVVASNYGFESPKVGVREFNLQRSLELHEAGGKQDSPSGYRNRLAVLIKKRIYAASKEDIPGVKEYQSVGKYGPAYVHAGHLAKKSKEKEKIFREAINCNFSQAYLDLGYLYAKEGKLEEAVKCYEEAGRLGVPRGYIVLSQDLIGDRTARYDKIELTKISRPSIDRSIVYLNKAAEAGDVEGWEQLIGLYKELYDHFKNEEDFRDLVASLDYGIKMGSSYAYRQARLMFPDRYEEFIAAYGPPYQQNLIDYVSQKLDFKVEEQ